MRREQLQKLAETSKANSLAKDNSNQVKRKQLHVPTLGNCNRGEFLTKELQLSVTKKVKLDNQTYKEPKTAITLSKRRATIECFTQEMNATNHTDNGVKSPPSHYSRPPERKEAEKARNKRTCNRVTFADMDRDFQYRQDMKKCQNAIVVFISARMFKSKSLIV